MEVKPQFVKLTVNGQPTKLASGRTQFDSAKILKSLTGLGSSELKGINNLLNVNGFDPSGSFGARREENADSAIPPIIKSLQDDPSTYWLAQDLKNLRTDLKSHFSYQAAIDTLLEKRANPRKARVDFVSRVFEQRGWLSKEAAEEIKDIHTTDALIRLRQIYDANAVVRKGKIIRSGFGNVQPGENAAALVQERMKKAGYDPDKLKVRFLSNNNYFNNALRTGSDRVESSLKSYFQYDEQLGNGEPISMIQAGITDAAETTYVNDLKFGQLSGDSPSLKILVYSGDALEPIGPAWYSAGNGFEAFLLPGVKKSALLATFERKKRVNLLWPFRVICV